jgi:hypothetical protein
LVKEKRHNVPRGMFAFIAILLTIAGCSRQLPPGERNNYHPFGVGHASLHLEYFGDTRGTEDMYEDSSGLREAHGIHSEFITEKAFHPTITYTARIVDSVAIVDSIKQQEIRLIDKSVDSLFHLPYSDVPTPQDRFRNYFEQRGYTLHGDTNILASGMNLKSHVWQLGEQASYIFEFKGLIVGTKNNIDGHENDLRLMSIDTTSPIDPARFEPPHGFPIIDRTKHRMNAHGSEP